MTIKTTAAVAALLAASTSVGFAGGYDRSGQSLSVIFEEGRYIEFSLGFVSPDITGTYAGAGGISSGNTGVDYLQIGAAYKADITESLSYALILDQPFGADISYPTGAGIIPGTEATLETYALTGILKYDITPNISVYGGPRLQAVTTTEVAVPPAAGYTAEGDTSFALGYSVGAAYQRKDIALRVALTYNSEVNHDVDTTENSTALGTTSSTTDITTPQSVNLEFQTGIAADTLLFGSVRWVNWDGINISPANYATITGGSLVEYDENTFTYSLGLGRRFNEKWSGAIQASYEPAGDGNAPNLGPTDGNLSVGVGATYKLSERAELSGGVRYVVLGDAITPGGGGITGDFSDNSAIAAGLKVAFRF